MCQLNCVFSKRGCWQQQSKCSQLQVLNYRDVITFVSFTQNKQTKTRFQNSVKDNISFNVSLISTRIFSCAEGLKEDRGSERFTTPFPYVKYATGFFDVSLTEMFSV